MSLARRPVHQSSARQDWQKYVMISVLSDSSVAGCAGAVESSIKLISLFRFLGEESMGACSGRATSIT